MDKNNIHINPFTGEKGKWGMWLGKIITRAVIKVYDVLLTGDKKIPADDTDKTKDKGVS